MRLLSQLCPRIWPLDVLGKCKLHNGFSYCIFILSGNTQRIIIHYNLVQGTRALPRKEEETVADVVFIYLNRKQLIEGILLKREFQRPHRQPPLPSMHLGSSTQPSWLISASFCLSLLGRETLVYTSTHLRLSTTK